VGSKRLEALVSWSGAQWFGRVPSLDGCEARARTKGDCLERLVHRAGIVLGTQLVPLVVEEEPPALVGMSEAAAILGWDRRKFATYVARGHVPRPLAELACGRVWRRADIEEFAVHRERGEGG
jgi:hypothetical protein